VSEVVVRRATKGDVPALAGLWMEYAEHHRRKDAIFTVARGARARWKRWVRKLLRTRNVRVWVAERRSVPVGFCSARIDLRPDVMKERRFGAVLDFAVTRASRRKGSGRRLFGECLRWFGSRGIRRVELRVVPSNREAKGFWRRMGFRPYVEVQFLGI
jgi:ribosomal protein S18 acetylase RimI-like enzyme